MKYRNIPFLFTLIIGVFLLNGCASTGTTPKAETTATAEVPAPAAAPAAEKKPTTKKKGTAGEAEPECD